MLCKFWGPFTNIVVPWSLFLRVWGGAQKNDWYMKRFPTHALCENALWLWTPDSQCLSLSSSPRVKNGLHWQALMDTTMWGVYFGPYPHWKLLDREMSIQQTGCFVSLQCQEWPHTFCVRFCERLLPRENNAALPVCFFVQGKSSCSEARAKDRCFMGGKSVNSTRSHARHGKLTSGNLQHWARAGLIAGKKKAKILLKVWVFFEFFFFFCNYLRIST